MAEVAAAVAAVAAVAAFHKQFLCLSLQRKKPEKDLGFNNVGRGIWKILHSCFFKNPCYTPVFYC